MVYKLKGIICIISVTSILLFPYTLYQFVSIKAKFYSKDSKDSHSPQNFQEKCKDIFEIHKMSPKCSSEWVEVAIDEIREAKMSRRFLSMEAYDVLANEGLNNVVESDPFQGLNGTNITIPFESLLDKFDWELPYLPCRLMKYKAKDIGMCEKGRLQRGKTFYLSFVGDSRIRYHLEILLDILRPFNLTIHTSEGGNISVDDFLGLKGNSQWTKYKNKLNVSCSDLPGLFLEFIWAPNLHRGSKSSLKWKSSLKSYKEKHLMEDNTTLYTQLDSSVGAFDELLAKSRLEDGQLPDIFFLNSGTWQLQSIEDILYNIDEMAVSGLAKLYPVLETLAEKTSVVFILPEPFKEYVFSSKNARTNYFTLQHSHNLEWYMNAQAQLLPKNVQVWDSFLPLGRSIILDCIDILGNDLNQEILPPHSSFDSQSSFSCTDRVHLGYRTVYIGVQLILNHLCNDFVVKTSENYCCVT